MEDGGRCRTTLDTDGEDPGAERERGEAEYLRPKVRIYTYIEPYALNRADIASFSASQRLEPLPLDAGNSIYKIRRPRWIVVAVGMESSH